MLHKKVIHSMKAIIFAVLLPTILIGGLISCNFAGEGKVINFKQEEFRWISAIKDGSVTKIKSGEYIKPKAPLDTYETYYDYERNFFIMELDDYYDIKEFKITFKDNKTYDYSIEFAHDDRIWVQPTIDKIKKSDNILSGNVEETYRKYVLAAVKGAQTSVDDIVKIEVYAAKTVAPPQPRTGEVIQSVATPIITPQPDNVTGVKEAVIDLSGTWKFKAVPTGTYWMNNAAYTEWDDVVVPGSPEIQGYNINSLMKTTQNLEFAYKTKVAIPSDAKGKRVFLQFSSVVTAARVWVNGYLVGTHSGSYTTFDFEITDYCSPGQDAVITVGVTRVAYVPEFEIANAGISGPVHLIITRQQHLTRFNVETDLDKNYKNADLIIKSAVEMGDAKKVTTTIFLYDPDGKEVKLDANTITYTGSDAVKVKIPVNNPKKWDAEHPNLYTIKAVVKADGKTVEQYSRKIGFREVTIDGNKFMVNGSVVHLRGVCWSNVDATKGMTFNYETDKESLLKLKQANVNMIRTAHYPQYNEILELCDEIGLYVELEATTMINTHWNPEYMERHDSLSNPDYLDWYVGVFASTVERVYSNPSVIYYSTGNESDWGDNIKAQTAYIRAVDKTRPIKYSWGYSAPEGQSDIFSVHYPGASQLYNKLTMPTIYDEYAHLYHQNASTIQEDPSLRDLYGYALKKEWDAVYAQEGSMGACIWNARDFIFYTPNGTWKTFNAEWGLLDSWNREKPEYYNTKKAYSPVQLDDLQVVHNPGAGKALTLSVENRYDHTSLSEVTCVWSVGDKSGSFKMPAIAPGKTGSFSVPARNWANGEMLNIKFIRNQYEVVKEYVIDQYEFIIGGQSAPIYKTASGSAPTVNQTAQELVVKGNDFTITFDKTEGKIKDGSYNGKTVITDGPELDFGVYEVVSGWSLKKLSHTIQGSEAIVTIQGSYNNIPDVTFVLRIDGTGRMEVSYTFKMPQLSANDIGVMFDLTKEFESISWNSKAGLWSYYPEDHIGRLSGTSYKSVKEVQQVYNKKPTWIWALDNMAYRISVTSDFRATNDFRAAKHNVYDATVKTSGGLGLRAELGGVGAVRTSVNKKREVVLRVNNAWGDIGVGEFQKHEKYIDVKTNQLVNYSFVLRFVK